MSTPPPPLLGRLVDGAHYPPKRWRRQVPSAPVRPTRLRPSPRPPARHCPAGPAPPQNGPRRGIRARAGPPAGADRAGAGARPRPGGAWPSATARRRRCRCRCMAWPLRASLPTPGTCQCPTPRPSPAPTQCPASPASRPSPKVRPGLGPVQPCRIFLLQCFKHCPPPSRAGGGGALWPWPRVGDRERVCVGACQAGRTRTAARCARSGGYEPALPRSSSTEPPLRPPARRRPRCPGRPLPVGRSTRYGRAPGPDAPSCPISAL